MFKRLGWLACAFTYVAAIGSAQLDQRVRPDITAQDANRLEEIVSKDPENLEAREQLLRYYFYNAQGLAGPYGAQPERLRHIQWLIEHHPEADLTGSVEAMILPGGPDSAATRAFERVRDLWKQQAANRSNDPRVLGNAGTFFESGDRELAADLLQQAAQKDADDARWSSRLADLYTKAMLDYGKSPADPKSEALAKKARAELEKSTDARLTGEAGRILAERAARFLPDSALLEDYNIFTEQLLVKAQAVDPDNPAWSATLKKFYERPTAAKGEITASGSTAMRLRVDGTAQAANLTWQTRPIYPARARQAKISGVVKFDAIIGTDGTVNQVRVISGHPLLAPAATDAVKQWRYRPAIVNNAPVEVATEIEVDVTKSE